MLYRIVPVALLALAPLFASTTVCAEDFVREGKLVSLVDSKLVYTCQEGKENSATLSSDVKLRCDGATCKSSALKPGMRIRITTTPENKQTITHVEAIEKQAAFDGIHDGKLSSITERKLVMTGRDGNEYSHILSPDVKLSCDGERCEWNAMKPGCKIRVTTRSENSQTVVRIEAIDKQELFEGTLDGQFVSNTENKLVMLDKNGKEQTMKLSINANVTCDDKACKLEDLKNGMKIRTSSSIEGNRMVVSIEAIDKNATFFVLN